MKSIIGYIVLSAFVFITFGLPLSLFFASVLMLKAVLIVTGIMALLFWSLFLITAFEYVGGNHE